MIAQPLEAPIHLRGLSLAATKQKGGNKIKFVNPNTDNYERNLNYAAALHKAGVATIKRNELKGKNAVIIGSGSTLKDPDVMVELLRLKDEGYILFACKQAIKVLVDAGITPQYAVTMDPGQHIARPEKIYKAEGTTHIVASSSDPLLWQYLLAGMPFGDWIKSLSEEDQKKVLEKDYDNYKSGTYELNDAGVDKAEVLIFHSATGYENEVKMYNELFDLHDCMGGGYNVVNRALSAAMFMGVDNIVMAGTDCGWRVDGKFYADDTNNRPGVDMNDGMMVEGTDKNGQKINNPNAREWFTRPDMLASGVALAKLAIKFNGKIKFIGDTLPAKLIEKDDSFLNKCASFHS